MYSPGVSTAEGRDLPTSLSAGRRRRRQNRVNSMRRARAMAPRANWKGSLKLGEITCPIALYSATSTSERIAFVTLNRRTGHRVHRLFVDSETGKPVDRDDQIKGYEISRGEYVVFEPEEIAATLDQSDKTLSVTSFVALTDLDDVYFDRPYYLAPADKPAAELYDAIREGIEKAKVVAIAQATLFRRTRTLAIRAEGEGLVATTLNYDYEVRPAEAAFDDIPAREITKEMLELAKHIIKTKVGKFDLSKFDDRYEGALAELVKAKLEGKAIAPPKQPKESNVVDLMAALRASAGVDQTKSKGGRSKARAEKRADTREKTKTRPRRAS
jgi:DNA end-binding protein Ku